MKFTIPSRSSTCMQCKSPFLACAVCFSALQKQANEYLREDFCQNCWKNSDRQIFWKTVLPETKTDKLDAVQKNRDERAIVLFRKALQNEELPKLFVLALFLSRRRILISREETKEETLFELWSTGEMFAIPHVPLSNQQIENLKQQIAADLADEKLT